MQITCKIKNNGTRNVGIKLNGSTVIAPIDGHMKKSGASQGQSASELISKRIAELGDWRGETLSRMRKLIKEADPDVVEEWKWMGTPICPIRRKIASE